LRVAEARAPSSWRIRSRTIHDDEFHDIFGPAAADIDENTRQQRKERAYREEIGKNERAEMGSD
jgi:hypothetical protein